MPLETRPFHTITAARQKAFLKGGKLINNAVDSVKNIVSDSVRPVVKKAARKTIKRVAQKIGRKYVFAQIEDLAYGGVYEFTSFYARLTIFGYRGE